VQALIVDAWVLVATEVGGGRLGAGLAGVLAAGDYLNHAVLEVHELEGAYRRLVGYGLVLVEVAPLVMRLTDAGGALLARAAGKDHVVTTFTNVPRELVAWYAGREPMLGIPTIDWAAERALALAASGGSR